MKLQALQKVRTPRDVRKILRSLLKPLVKEQLTMGEEKVSKGKNKIGVSKEDELKNQNLRRDRCRNLLNIYKYIYAIIIFLINILKNQMFCAEYSIT